MRFKSKIEQAAAFLREEIARGRWVGEMPGKEELAIKLGVNSKTMGLAMQLIQREGLIVSQGPGRRRLIVPPEGSTPALNIRILLYDQSDYALFNNRDLIRRLALVGHSATVVEKSLKDLRMDVRRIAGYVASMPADAWIVTAATQEILEWFSRQDFPTLALFGQSNDVDVSFIGIDKVPPMRDAVRRLVALGHRRIVFLSRCERRKPCLPRFEQAFLEELQSHGITTGAYHLPEWTTSIAGFHHCLDSLFGKTPPTAMIIDESVHFLAAQLYLARRGIVCPRDVSMICLDPDEAFSWCETMISHIGWDPRVVGSNAVKWVNGISAGKYEIKHSLIPAVFREGGTIGPVSTGR